MQNHSRLESTERPEEMMTGPNPDPHALAIAKAVQEEVAPDTVILFGSRAAGDYRPHSAWTCW